ncbi:Vitamin D 25-hydroxylase [Halotydeus destructor]|nr:Vitamin D 25-hydroxylase [Halotydeus destructor]
MNSQHTYDITDQVMDETFINIAARAKDKDFDISDYTTFMSCNLISGWVFGKTMPFDSEYYKEAILVNERTHMCLGLLSAGCLIRQIRYLFRLFGIEKLVFANMNRVQKESLKKLIDTESCPDDKKPIARHLLDTRNDLRNSQPDTRWRHMTEDNIAASLVENTFASSQVSELFFKWMILYLAKNHDIQIRLRQEIVSLDDSTFMGNSQKYIYTQAFIAELLRLRTTTSINTGHVLSQDMEISGYQVRKGTLIALDVHSINCDPIFGPAPESFNPDRFIDNGYFDKMKYSKIAHFGLGARSCPAKELVRHQYCAALVRMLKITKGQFFVMSPDFESTVDDADPRKWVLVCPKKYHMRIVADNNNYVC